MWQEIAFEIISIGVNVVQIWLYLPVYFALLDQERSHTVGFIATAAAILLNVVAVLKKLVIVVSHMPFLFSHKADALYHIANTFLIFYFFAVYIPVYLSRYFHAKEEAKK